MEMTAHEVTQLSDQRRIIRLRANDAEKDYQVFIAHSMAHYNRKYKSRALLIRHVKCMLWRIGADPVLVHLLLDLYPEGVSTEVRVNVEQFNAFMKRHATSLEKC